MLAFFVTLFLCTTAHGTAPPPVDHSWCRFLSPDSPTIHVSINGTNSPHCGASSSPCGTIRHAVEVVAPSLNTTLAPIVSIGAGYYTASAGNCNTTVPRSLAVVGGGHGGTIVACEGGGVRAMQVLGIDVSVCIRALTVSGGECSAASRTCPGAAKGGGGVLVEWGSPSGIRLDDLTLTILDVVLVNNTAAAAGAGLTVIGNPAVNMSGTKISIVRSHFNNTTGYSAGGFVVSLQPMAMFGTTVMVTDCWFVDNVASHGAGALNLFLQPQLLENSTITVAGSRFTGNVGSDTGAVYVQLSPTAAMVDTSITMVDSIVANNIGYGYVGGLYLYLIPGPQPGSMVNTSISASGTVFENNIGSDAGAVFVILNPSAPMVATTSIVSGCVFRNNLASNSGHAGGVTFKLLIEHDVLNTIVALRNDTFIGNSGYAGGLQLLLQTSNPSSMVSGTTISLAHTTFTGNTGLLSGGVSIDWSAVKAAPSTSVLLHSCALSSNIATGGSGGGAMIGLPRGSPANTTFFGCRTNPPTTAFRQWTRSASVVLSSLLLSNNTASGRSNNGGGFAMTGGGTLALFNVTAVGNAAGLYGGGLYLGPDVEMRGERVHLGGNTAAAGAQLASLSGGSIHLTYVTVSMSTSSAQVVVLQGGNFTVAQAVVFSCPVGSQFSDEFGLYDGLAYAISFARWLCPMLVTTLSYRCSVCSEGQYSLDAGHSNGTIDKYFTGSCHLCPHGAECAGGTITAAAGYWGAADAHNIVSMVGCPHGYCCDGDSEVPCVSVSSCAPHRVGLLCGACQSGYSEQLGSPSCHATEDCNDGAWVWPLAIIAIFIAGVFMLRLSDLWAPSPDLPTGAFKLAAYYFQLASLILSTRGSGSASSDILQSLLSIVSLKVPTTLSAGVCAIPGLTAVGKACMDYIVPCAVSVAMVLLFVIGMFVDRRQWCSGCRRLCWGPHAYRHAPQRRAEREAPLLGSLEQEVEADPSISNATVMRTRHRVYSAGWNLLMLVYFNVATATLALLRCVEVPGADGYRLFIDANIKCVYYGWQLPLLLLGVALLTFPVYVRWRADRARRRRFSSGHDFDAVLYRTIGGMYREQCSFWEGVLISHRLAVAFLFTFVTEALVMRSVLIGTVTVGVLAAHAVYRPLRFPATQVLQLVLLFCLSTICFIVVPASTQDNIAATSTQLQQSAVHDSNTFLSVMTLVFGYIIPVLAFLWALRRGRAKRLILWWT